MGCGPSSSDVLITLDRSPAIFFSNEIVSGKFQLNINKETVNVDELVMKFIGEACYITTEDTVVNGQPQTQTRYHTVPLVSITHVLASPPVGKKELIYSKGQYDFPFQIQLPANLPPSLGSLNKYPHVRYYVQMCVDKAWYRANTEGNTYITFLPLVFLSKVPNALKPTMFGQQQNNVTVKGSLSKLGYLQGEIIEGVLDIENPRQNVIKQVTLQLIENWQIGNKPIDQIQVQSTIPELVFRREPRINQPFTFALPTKQMISSYQFQGGLRQTITINNNFFLKISVQMEGFATNAEVLVPVIIGNQP